MRIDRHRRRKPGRGYRSGHSPLARADDGERVCARASDVQRLPVGSKRHADRLAAQRAFGIGGDLQVCLRQGTGVDQRNGIRVPICHRQRFLIRTQRQPGWRETDRDFAHRVGFRVHDAHRARSGSAGDRVGDHLRAAAGGDGIAGERPASPAIRNVNHPLLAQRDGKRRDPDRDLLLYLAGLRIDHGQGIVAAEGDVGGGAVGGERDARRQGMPFEFDVGGLAGHAHIGNFSDEDAVRSVAGRLAGPQFPVAGPEHHPGIGRGAGLDFGDLGPCRAVHHQHAARVQDRQNSLLRVEGEIHGPARKKRLLSPGLQELVGRDEENAARLLADGGVALEDRKDSRLLSCQGGERQEGADDRQLSHGLRLSEKKLSAISGQPSAISTTCRACEWQASETLWGGLQPARSEAVRLPASQPMTWRRRVRTRKILAASNTISFKKGSRASNYCGSGLKPAAG